MILVKKFQRKFGQLKFAKGSVLSTHWFFLYLGQISTYHFWSGIYYQSEVSYSFSVQWLEAQPWAAISNIYENLKIILLNIYVIVGDANYLN